MDYMNITEKLRELKDDKYADFNSRLIPNIDRETIIGVRMPLARKLAAEYSKSEETATFLKDLPHKYHDENIMHALLISREKDFLKCINLTEEFLPYINNWAVSDILSPAVFKKHREELLPKITEWIDSGNEYSIRFGVGMLMGHFLTEDFKPEYLKIPAGIFSGKYYVNMMLAWFYAEALAKRWEDSVLYLENNMLPVWVHNKAIQKARESFRIPPERKEYLKTLKR